MTDTAIAKREPAQLLEQVVVGGDLGKLTSGERVNYYRQVCDSLGLNPLTRPFQYITLNGRLTLYASRDCTDQLRKLHRVSVTIVNRELRDELYIVSARATLPDGRTDESIGAVTVGGLKGDALANALMKAETKAKRRATLSIVGLGWLDETEVETIPDAQPASQVDVPTVPPPEASVPKGDAKASIAMLDRWAELWREAATYGIQVEPLPEDASAALVIERGKALKARIAEARASQPTPKPF